MIKKIAINVTVQYKQLIIDLVYIYRLKFMTYKNETIAVT